MTITTRTTTFFKSHFIGVFFLPIQHSNIKMRIHFSLEKIMKSLLFYCGKQ